MRGGNATESKNAQEGKIFCSWTRQSLNRENRGFEIIVSGWRNGGTKKE